MEKTLQDLVKNVQAIKSLGCPSQQKSLIDLVLGMAKEVLGKDFPEVELPVEAVEAAEDETVSQPKSKAKKKKADKTEA